MVTTALKPSTPGAPGDRPPSDDAARYETPLLLRLPTEWRLTDAALSELAGLNDLEFERTAEGDLVVTLPPHGRAPRVGAAISAQIWNWVEAGGGGEVADSSGGFRLGELPEGEDRDSPNQVVRAPDVSWMSLAQVAATAEQDMDERYLEVCPALIVEIISAKQRVIAQQRRMVRWMEYGAQLGWLIDPQRNTAWIYRTGAEQPEELDRPATLSGEDVLPGFELDCAKIWR